MDRDPISLWIQDENDKTNGSKERIRFEQFSYLMDFIMILIVIILFNDDVMR